MRPKKDLTDQQFGMLRVISEVEAVKTDSGNRLRRWLCQCECGNELVVRQKDLLSGHTTSCGCKKGRPNSQPLDLVGKKFGRLTVLEESNEIKYKNGKVRRAYVCRCDCGNTKVVYFMNSGFSFPKCPSCGSTFEREYTSYCDRCGRCLDWRRYEEARIERKEA